jgi:diguanylate cyclase (GGDEF)-like protein/PAS domain S-box-containing protein
VSTTTWRSKESAFHAALWLACFALSRLLLDEQIGLSLISPAYGALCLWALREFGARPRLLMVSVVAGATGTHVVVAGTDRAVALVLLVSMVAGAWAFASAMGSRPEGGDLATLRDGWLLIGASAVGAGVSAGVIVVAGAAIAPLDLGFAGLVGVRNMSGCLVVLSVALAWQNRRGTLPGAMARLLVVDTLLAAVMFGAVLARETGVFAGVLPLVLTLWISFRGDVFRTAVHVTAAAGTVVGLTLAGLGPFAGLDQRTAFIIAQLYLLVVIVVGLTVTTSQCERRAAGRAAHRNAVRLGHVLDGALIAHLTLRAGVGSTFVIIRANPAAASLLGSPAERVVGRPFRRFVVPEAWALVDRGVSAVCEGHQSEWQDEVPIVQSDGTTRWVLLAVGALPDDAPSKLAGDPDVASGEVRSRHYLSAQMLDVTERREAEQRLAHLALHDELTGLANRTLLQDRVEQDLARCRREGGHVAVIFVDLNHFKHVNDSLGHAVGDDLLRAVAARLLEVVRECDTVARIGGDEFVLSCPGLRDLAEAELMAARCRDSLTEPVRLAGHVVAISASAGVALSDTASTAASLLSQSDAAMYEAKECGRGRVQVFRGELAQRSERFLALRQALRTASMERAFAVRYQPIIELGTGMVRAVEALVRWEDPERGLVPASAWIDVAEEEGLMVEIGRQVLETACADAVTLQESRPLDVHVNISARQLDEPGLAADVRQVLGRTGLRPERLVLEITQDYRLGLGSSALRQLQELRELGVRVAADDFGTGYSSLERLIVLPVDVVKMDETFADSLGPDSRASTVVRAVVTMAAALGIDVIAKGVRTDAQVRVLTDAGCAAAQGRRWGEPVTWTRLTHTFLRAGVPHARGPA